MLWWQPDVFLVSGMPRNGKSVFSINYAKIVSNTVIFHVDTLFEKLLDSFPEENNIRKTFDIYMYVNHESFNKQNFMDIFIHDITSFLVEKTNTNVIILEGYVCQILHDDIVAAMKRLYNFKNFHKVVTQQDLNGFGVLFDDVHVGYATDFNYKNIIKEIHLSLIKSKNIIDRTTYQRFPWTKELNSKSEEKFDKSIKDCNFVGKTFIDFGCNSGWFCFRAKERGALLTTGIDCAENWIDLASAINTTIYNYGNMEWLCINIFDFDRKTIYDIVYCASTFHYFGKRQKEFIELVHSISDKNTEFYLEVEISPKTDVDIDWVARNADTIPMSYPTMGGFKNMISNLFKIESVVESAFQPGSLYTRYFFKMTKI